MRYIDQFERFDPITGDVNPRTFGGLLIQISSRARKVLQGRTVAELHSAAQFIDWAIDYYIDDSCEVVGLKEEESIDRADHNDVEWFKECGGNISFSSNKDFVGGKYADYFAVLSMWQLIDALECAGLILGKYPNTQIDLSDAAEYAIQAMQAICIADQWKISGNLLLRSEKAFSVVSKLSINGTAAAIKSHIKDNELRAKGIALYLAKYTDLSVQEAAKRIGVQVHRSPVTVAKWLYAENKKLKKQF